MSEGILQSARVVLNDQLQMAAATVLRVNGRYTAMRNVVASSCKVCKGDPTPLWELRARRVVHDQTERQIYFDSAQFRLGGVPVFYIPRLRMPDPTLKRASGFMMPSFHTSSTLGTGFRVPYFLTLGRHKDLMITPYITSSGTRSVELRYRQAFANGDISITGTLSRDDLMPGEARGYLNAEAQFRLPKGFKLRIHSEAVTDDAYLLDYGLPAKDRLNSRIEISRTQRNEHISARLISFQSLRAGESSQTIPRFVGDVTYYRRFTLGVLGGEGGLRFQGHGHGRSSHDVFDTDLDGIADGRDVARVSIRADWRRDWTMQNGLIFGVLGEATADVYGVQEDAAFAGTSARLHGAVAAELRWPWVKSGRNGVSHVIEPVAQIVVAPAGTETLLNEDSVLVEFDEANLFALNRYPGSDAVERGIRANIGLNYLRLDPTGWSLGLTVGRVFRADDATQFSAASGLDGFSSDWLAAWQFQSANGLQVTSRLLLDDDFNLTKGELRLGLSRERFGIEASYLFVGADPVEKRPIDTEELVFDSRVAIGRGWTAKIANRYDLVADRASRAAFGLAFRNECLSVDLSLSRRFTSSTSVQPTTDFGVSLELLGFGGSAAAGEARQCRG
jgi:LPS-assembly protein